MMIPVQADPPLLGPPSQEVTHSLRGIKVCVVAMYICGLLRLAQGDSSAGALASLIPAMAGTCIFRGDPCFRNYQRYLQSPSARGQGGVALACLPVVAVLSGFAGILSLFPAVWYLWLSFHAAVPAALPLVVLISAVVNLASCIVGAHAWRLSNPGLLAGLVDPADDVEGQRDGYDAADGDLLQRQADMRMAMELQQHGDAADQEHQELCRALRLSRQDETRQIVQQQDQEFEECLALDQVREIEAQEERERLRLEEEKALADEAAREKERIENEALLKQQAEAKRQRLPGEPERGETDRLVLAFRLPSGQRRQRGFRSSDTVGSLYDYADLEEEQLASMPYLLVSQMPRKVFSDRAQTLADAEIGNQCVILVEVD